ncbi:MAG: glutathione S-transferase N-terminal domain-containing protein [Chromatiales bacterium]|nr:glutathione S-transferase N-terminal domain-containing protein [Chromatiales bacterium]
MSLWNQIGNMLGGQTPERSPEEQQAITEACQPLSLYYYMACPFCMRVLHTIKHLDLPIEERNIHHSEEHARDLIEGGGMGQVPCLRIDHEDGSTQWMYESGDIVAYLKERFQN